MIDVTHMPYVDGWRGRIGLITPAPGSSTEWEFNHYKPEGVAVLTTRVPLFGISREGLEEMNRHVDDAAVMLAHSAVVDLLLFSCTAGSFLEGPGYDQEIVRHLEQLTGVRTTTTSTCVQGAIQALGLRSLCVVTPYSAQVNQLERQFLEGIGVEVASMGSALLDRSQDTPKLTADIMCDLVRAADSPRADGIFISCTGLHVDRVIEPLEAELGKPVITSNQCGLWGCVRMLGIGDAIPGLGSLFRRDWKEGEE